MQKRSLQELAGLVWDMVLDVRSRIPAFSVRTQENTIPFPHSLWNRHTSAFECCSRNVLKGDEKVGVIWLPLCNPVWD